MITEETRKSFKLSQYEQKWLDGLNNGDVSTADEVFLPDCVIHINGGAQRDLPLEQFKQMVAGLIGAFPDLHFTIEDHFVASDKAATRWTATGTNTGDFGEIKATGKQMETAGLIIDHLINGKVAERWELWDQMSMLQQLGLM